MNAVLPFTVASLYMDRICHHAKEETDGETPTKRKGGVDGGAPTIKKAKITTESIDMGDIKGHVLATVPWCPSATPLR